MQRGRGRRRGLNLAYDELLTARAVAAGLNRHRARLLGALNASLPAAEAAIALGLAGTRPPPLVSTVTSRLAEAIRQETGPPMIPPPWDAEVRARQRRPLGQVLLEELGSGRLGRIFTARLMVCMGVADLVSEVLPLQRSPGPCCSSWCTGPGC